MNDVHLSYISLILFSEFFMKILLSLSSSLIIIIIMICEWMNEGKLEKKIIFGRKFDRNFWKKNWPSMMMMMIIRSFWKFAFPLFQLWWPEDNFIFICCCFIYIKVQHDFVTSLFVVSNENLIKFLEYNLKLSLAAGKQNKQTNKQNNINFFSLAFYYHQW